MADQENVPDAPPVEAESATPEPDSEHWKRMSRKNERDLKAERQQRAALEARLAELENASKSEDQIRSERAAKAERERDELRAELVRFQVATRYELSEDDLDLLGHGDEDEIEARAKKVAALKAAAEAAAASAPGPGRRPVESLRPGASPDHMPLNGDPLLASVKSKLGIP